MKYPIFNLFLSFLVISILSCNRETIISSATINGDPYEEKGINSITGPSSCKYIVFSDSLKYGVYNTVLSPLDKKQPSYCIYICLLGTGDNFVTGKTFKLVSPPNISQLLNCNNKFIEIKNLNDITPIGLDGIAFCYEINGDEYVNLTGLNGLLEIYTYDNITDLFCCKYILKNDSNPPLSISNGYMKVIKTKIK